MITLQFLAVIDGVGHDHLGVHINICAQHGHLAPKSPGVSNYIDSIA